MSALPTVYVAVFNSPLYGGGVEQVVAHILSDFPKDGRMGLRIVCSDPDQPETFEYAGYPCINLAFRRTKGPVAKMLLINQLRFSWRLSRYLARHAAAADAANVHGIEYAFWLRFRRPPCPVVLTAHGCLFSQYTRFLAKGSRSVFARAFFSVWRWYIWLIESVALGGASETICISDQAKSDLRSVYRHAANHMIPNGVTLEKRAFRSGKAAGAQTGIIIGSRALLKGLDVAAEAVRLLANPQFRLLVLGFPPEDAAPYRDIPSFEYVGRVRPEEVDSWLKKADILIMPSRYEVFPLTMLEALCSGIPVITSPVCDLASVQLDPPIGAIVESYRAEEWAAAIAHSIAPPAYGDLVKNVAAMDLTKYSWQSIAQSYHDAYASVL